MEKNKMWTKWFNFLLVNAAVQQVVWPMSQHLTYRDINKWVSDCWLQQTTDKIRFILQLRQTCSISSATSLHDDQLNKSTCKVKLSLHSGLIGSSCEYLIVAEAWMEFSDESSNLALSPTNPLRALNLCNAQKSQLSLGISYMLNFNSTSNMETMRNRQYTVEWIWIIILYDMCTMSSSSSSHTLTLVPKDVEREINKNMIKFWCFFRVQERQRRWRGEKRQNTKQYVNCMHRKVPDSRPLAQHAGIRIRCL